MFAAAPNNGRESYKGMDISEFPLYPSGSELTPEEYKSLRFQFGIFKRGLKFLRCQFGTSKGTLTRFD